MCIADDAQSGFLQSNLSYRTRAVRFSMKLPRCGSSSAAATAAITQDQEKSSRVGVRRSQSAQAARSSRPWPPAIKGNRSVHSEQDWQPLKTQELPIPLERDHHGRPVRSASSAEADRTDLARMYDHATWNMYERIVSARRRRLACETHRRASQPDELPTPQQQTQQTPQPKQTFKVVREAPSTDESTTVTAAETECDWSRNNSPLNHPGVRTAVPGRNCPAVPGLEAEEDHFIFELDM